MSARSTTQTRHLHRGNTAVLAPPSTTGDTSTLTGTKYAQNGRGLDIRPIIKCELKREMEYEDDEVARDIRNLVEQKGEREPDKKEAHAMATLCRLARGTFGK
jgi:hypothetical protein